MPHNLTVLRIHKFHVQVEGAADPVVRDHWGEDLRAVHLSCNLVAWKIPWGRFPQIWTVRHCVTLKNLVLITNAYHFCHNGKAKAKSAYHFCQWPA